MATINNNYLKLKAGYLFPEIARRVNAFAQANPDAPIIRLGIGDVTEPLPLACRAAMTQAVEDMGDRSKFKGYGPEQGYDWLRAAIATNDFRRVVAILMHPKSSSQTAQNAIVATFSTFSDMTTRSRLLTPYTPFTSILM